MGKHAYLILAHNNPNQLQLLLELIDDVRNHIFVHIDKKSDIKPFLLNGVMKSQIDFIVDRVAVYWGDISQIHAELNLLDNVVGKTESYDYIHLLSGADMPLRTQDEIHQFFDSHIGEEFIDYCNSEFNFLDLIEKTEYPFFGGKYLSKKDFFSKHIGRRLFSISRKLVKAFHIKNSFDVENLHKGSQWFSITGDCARWIVDRKEEIIRNFRYTWCCDEIFLQSYVMTSPYAKNISRLGNLRYIDWTRGNPYVWQNNDYDELMNSGAMFARKFSMELSPDIINRIAKSIK